MPTEQITVLHVDDDPQFVEVSKAMLEREHGTFDVIPETDPRAVPELLERHTVDCLVIDYEMPAMDGIELLERVRDEYPALPVILFTGEGTETVASRAISAGVTDYIQKEGHTDQFTVLANRIENAVERRAHERRRDQHRAVVETAGNGIYVLDKDGHIEIVNEAFERISGYDRETLLGSHVSEFLSPEQVEKGTDVIQSLIRNDDRESEQRTFRARGPGGEPRLYETTVSLVGASGFEGSLGIVRDVTDKRRREELLSGLFESSLHGIAVLEIVTDESGEPVDYVYRRVNDQFESLTGLDADELVGRRVTDAVDGITDAPFVERFGKVALDGATAQFEGASEPLGGYYEVAAFSPRQGECLSIMSDITERKRRESELERTRNLLRHTQEMASVGGWEVDTETGEQRWTRETYAIHDLDPDGEFEPTVESGLEFYHPEDRERITRLVTRCIEKGEPYDAELRLQTAEDRVRWVRTAGEPVDGGSGNAVRGAIQDITEQQNHKRTLHRLAQRADELIEETDRTTIAQVAVDIANNVIEAPLAGAYLLSEDGERLEGVAGNDSLRAEFSTPPVYGRTDDSTASELAFRVLDRGESLYIEDSENYGKLAEESPAESGVVCPLGGHGVLIISKTEPFAFSEKDRDLVELVAQSVTAALNTADREEELRASERHLQQERDRLEQFASVVSHDLRNPLNVATLRADLAARECDSEHISDVMEALSRMESLIEKLRLLTRQGDIIGERGQVSLPEIVTTCWHNVETGKATLTTDVQATLSADRDRLTQVFENLFHNAVHHGDESVTVTVGSLDGEDGFYVSDTGPGIPAEERADVFDSGFSTTHDGTGLGLAIVRRVCEAHGWEINVTTGDTGGARFEISGVESLER